MKHYDEAFKQKALVYLNTGASIKETADAFNVSEGSISLWRAKNRREQALTKKTTTKTSHVSDSDRYSTSYADTAETGDTIEKYDALPNSNEIVVDRKTQLIRVELMKIEESKNRITGIASA